MSKTSADNHPSVQGTGPARPARHLKIVEQFGPLSTDLSRIATSFAGLLAAQFGASVYRVECSDSDPACGWSAEDGDTHFLYRFLTQSKNIVTESPNIDGAYLLTDDGDRVKNWPTSRTILIRSSESSQEQLSELTAQAKAGLLDIFAGNDRKPRPLPGNQLAYTAGIAAFNALLAGHLNELRGGSAEPTVLSILDTALWINWKHYLAAINGEKRSGLSRIEEWNTLRCADGFVALTFQDKDMRSLATLTNDDFFLSPQLRTRALRQKNVHAINEAIEKWTRHKTRTEVVKQAQALRIPVGPVLDVEELTGDAQFQYRNFFFERHPGCIFPSLPVLWNGKRVVNDANKATNDSQEALS